MAITDKLSAIADAIREKTNTTEKMTLADMPGLITSITGGGTEQYVNFYDYDGTLLHQYPVSVFKEMAAMPYPPNSLPGCRCTGWNYDLETIKDMGTHVNVAAIYEQLDEEKEVFTPGEKFYVDGTKLYMHIERTITIPFYFRQSMGFGVTINWGDGTESFSGSGVNSNQNIPHTYEPGDYIITFALKEGCKLTLGAASTSTSMLGAISANGTNYPILSTLVKAEIDLRDTIPSTGAFRACINLKEITFGDGAAYVMPTYLFSICYSLERVHLCESITALQQYAFHQCYRLREIEIPASVTYIYGNCFAECRRLYRIRIPGTVKTIDGSAFANCTSLMEAEIGSGVEVINSSAFSGCRSLRKVNLPNTIKTIGTQAFYTCSIKEIILPNKVTSISTSAFQNCYSLKTVILPEGLTTIFSSAFANNSCIQFLAFPKSLTTIGDSAFSGCFSLRNAVFGMAVRSIGANAFQNAYGLEYVILPKSVTTVGVSAFYGCRILKNVVLPEVAQIMSAVLPGCDYYQEPPAKQYQKMMESCDQVRDYAFDGCRYLEKGKLKDEITTIGTYAFRNAGCLEQIELPALLTDIGNNAFQADYRLKGIAFPRRVTTIGSNAFDSCMGIERLKLANAIRTVNSSAFVNEYGLENVEIATSLILGTSTFGNSYRLEKVLFSDPHANVTIGGSCFSNSGLREFTDPPKSVAMSESSCFSSCFGLEKADLSKSYFGGVNAANSLFGSCYALSDVKLPQYMNIMGSYMFQNCYALNGIVDIPADVETISSYVFTECKNLRGVNFLGSSVKTIQSNAFYNCSNLKELKIPPHVATMANCCNYCYTLEKIWMYPLTPPTGTTTLGNISTVYTIYVPKGTLAKYEAQFTAHKGHFQEFIYLISERQSIKKSIKPDVSSVEFSTVFAHTEFDEDQTFTLTYTYDGRNLAEIRNMSFDFETAAVRFDFDRAEDFDYDAHEEMHFHVEADGLGIGCDFTLRFSYVAEGQISEYVVTPIGGYPFNPVGEDTYESTCKGINSAYSLCMLTFTTTTGTLFLDCINGGENSCDYGIVSNLDTTLVNSVTSDSGASVKRNFAGSGDSCTETLVYDVNDMEEHFIYIKYRKDGSVHRGTDCLRFTVRFE